MDSKILIIPKLISGGIITNYNCTSRCRHCLYRCSPAWPRDYIDCETTRKNLEMIRAKGCSAIHIGGGEPLLNPESVAMVLDVAAAVGIYVEYVETNSSWFRDLENACMILEELRRHGLTSVLVSISPFHNEYIPFYKVRGVLEACRLTGISVFPWISEFIDDIILFDESTHHALEEYERHFGDGYVAALPCRYWISPGGRALETFSGNIRGISIDRLSVDGSGGCSELAETSHFHMDLYGHYIPGLCSGLAIRRDDLAAPLDPESYPIISRLYARGIGEFLAYARERFEFHPSRSLYGSKCELCYEIRRFLVVNRGLTSHELQPVGHYVYG